MGRQRTRSRRHDAPTAARFDTGAVQAVLVLQAEAKRGGATDGARLERHHVVAVSGGGDDLVAHPLPRLRCPNR